MIETEGRVAPHRWIPPLYRDPAYRWYAWGKLRSDPIYDRVAAHLPADRHPVLDVGCGSGIMVFFLRYNGVSTPVVGIDADRRKISAAQDAGREWEARHGGIDATFQTGDARSLPAFEGHVLLLDVVHYVAPDQQEIIVTEAASRVAPGARLILRDALQDGSWRARATMVQERFSRAIGWLRGERLVFPRLELLDEWTGAAGLQRVHLEPMTRGNPFNNHLVVWQRPSTGGD